MELSFCHTHTSQRPIKNYLSIGKKKVDILHLLLLEEKVLFKESPPSIMVTRNPKLVNKDSMVRDWLHKREDVITH